jgi:hypothetical protein
MAYLQTHRERIEAILTTAYGTTRTIAAGRFHLGADDSQDLASTAERRVTVRVGPGKNLPGTSPNELDSYKLSEHMLTVAIEYMRTTAGGGLAESITDAEQQGPATDEAIDDRIAMDQTDVAAVLCWYENWTGLTPSIIKIEEVRDAAPVVTRTTDTVRAVITFVLWTQDVRTASYAA